MYRICEIQSALKFYRSVATSINSSSELGADLPKSYQINDKTLNQGLDLKHGKSVKMFLMDKVSNSPFEPVRAFSYT